MIETIQNNVVSVDEISNEVFGLDFNELDNYDDRDNIYAYCMGVNLESTLFAPLVIDGEYVKNTWINKFGRVIQIEGDHYIDIISDDVAKELGMVESILVSYINEFDEIVEKQINLFKMLAESYHRPYNGSWSHYNGLSLPHNVVWVGSIK